MMRGIFLILVAVGAVGFMIVLSAIPRQMYSFYGVAPLLFHFLVPTVITGLVVVGGLKEEWSRVWVFCAAVLTVVLAALASEAIQFLVSVRVPSFFDLGVDFAGGLLGIIVAFVYARRTQLGQDT